jgi:hypothetical protein
MISKINITIAILTILFGVGFADWQSLNGPPMGRADDLSIGKQDDNVYLYAADCYHRLYKSDNAGTQWDSIWRIPDTYYPKCVVTAPSNADVVFIGRCNLPGPKVMKSVDGGEYWVDVTGSITNPLCYCFAIHPNYVENPPQNRIIFLGCLSQLTNPQPTVWKSEDGGGSWSNVSPPEWPLVYEIALNPDNPSSELYMATSCGVYYSSNGGNNWSLSLDKPSMSSVAYGSGSVVYAGSNWCEEGLFKKIGAQNWVLVGDFDCVSAVAAVSESEVFIAARRITTLQFGIFRTTDGGATWEYYGPEKGIFCNTSKYSTIFDIISDPDYSINHNVYAAGEWAIYRFDYGSNYWEEITKGFQVDTMPRFDIKNNHMYVTGRNRRFCPNLSVWRTTNGGNDWVCINGHVLTGPQGGGICNEWAIKAPSLINIDYSNISTLFATGLPEGGVDPPWYGHIITKSINSGIGNWTTVYEGIWPFGLKIYDLCIAPQQTNTIFAVYNYLPPYDMRIVRSTNSGASWDTIIDGLDATGDIYTIEVNPQQNNIVYCGTQNEGVYKSTNNGEQWCITTLNTGEVRTLGIDPDITSTVYAGMTSGLKKTTDSGDNWFDANQGLNYTYITDIEVDPEEPTILYLIGQTDDQSTANHCYLTVDRAAKWIEITDGLPDYTYALEIDPNHPEKTYSSTQVGLYTYTPDFNKHLVSSSEDATAFNGGKHLVRLGTTLWCCYSSGNVVFVTKSSDLGNNWSKKMELGGGVLPAIDRVEISMPGGPEVGVAWVSRGASCDTVYFREYANSTWQNSYVVYTTDGTIGPPSVTYTNDQIFVIFDETPAEPNGEYVVCAHFRPGYEPTVDTLVCGPVIGYCSIDYSNNYVHVVWEQNGEIYYNYYYNDNWGADPYRVSNGDGYACQPMIEAYNNYIYVTYSDLDGPDRNIYWRYHFFDPDYRWSGIIPVTSTSNSSEYSSLSNGLQCTYTEAGEIWYCHYDGLTWTGHRNISQTLGQQSIYSHINFYQTPFFTKTFFIWTEGNSPPYDVEFRNHTLEGSVPTGFINPGEIEPAPENIYRDGYRSYGEKSYEYHDYGDDYIAYRVTNLNPEYIYEFEFLGYYNEGNTRLRVSVDDISRIQISLNQGELIRKKFEVPAQLYSDSTILLKIKRMTGPEASLALLLIYEYEKESGGLGGPQSHANVSADKLLFDISPTLSSRSFNIRLQGIAGKKVSLKVYDATGRLVKDFSPLLSDIGYQSSIIWDAKDDHNRKLSSGVYFIRLETEDHKATKKAILLR